VALRRRIAALGRASTAATRAAVTRRPDERTAAWVTSHRDALQVGGIVAGIAALLLIDVSWFGLVVLLLVVGGFELAVRRIAGERVSAPGVGG
jgi:phage shock protein PspC (stress-responsive transcriptional regulator)